ncbi:MAG: Loki-CTERM sorting domain-containing protein, partial [Promethearchaeota archaeon]
TFNRYYSGVKPHELKISLIDISLVLENNTTEEIPGYPIISLMIALGIGLFWILKRKNGVINVNKMEGVTK